MVGKRVVVGVWGPAPAPPVCLCPTGTASGDNTHLWDPVAPVPNTESGQNWMNTFWANFLSNNSPRARDKCLKVNKSIARQKQQAYGLNMN